MKSINIKSYSEYSVPSVLWSNVKKKKIYFGKIEVIRYADGFLVIINHKPFVGLIKEKIEIFLKLRGLAMNTVKSIIYESWHKAKFKYLGYEFIYLKNTFRKNKSNWFSIMKGRTPKKSKTHKAILKSKSGWFIRPHVSKVTSFHRKVKKITANRNQTGYEVAIQLNQIIRDWGHYFLMGNCSHSFYWLDHLMWKRLMYWCITKHARMNRFRVFKKYWIKLVKFQ